MIAVMPSSSQKIKMVTFRTTPRTAGVLSLFKGRLAISGQVGREDWGNTQTILPAFIMWAHKLSDQELEEVVSKGLEELKEFDPVAYRMAMGLADDDSPRINSARSTPKKDAPGTLEIRPKKKG